MAGHDLCGKAFPFGQGLILLINDIPYRCDFLAWEHLAKVQRENGFNFEAIEAYDYIPAFAQDSAPDLSVMADGFLIEEEVCLHAKGILVDRDDFLVAEDGERGLSDALQVAADEQWRFQGCPKGEVGLVLVVSHEPIANLQHVRIIPCARLCVLR